uniref:Uncharacterized protein n=1 Tax=Octopus bimaculoides TaxID=37653 RepID=A0A0L8HYC0_OCTBM
MSVVYNERQLRNGNVRKCLIKFSHTIRLNYIQKYILHLSFFFELDVILCFESKTNAANNSTL